MATQKPRPVHTFACATVRATIWKNTGKKGEFFSITLSRTFQDGEGNPKTSDSFGVNDLSAVAKVIEQAEGWVREHSK